jgi:phage terminase large subunit-like protein
LPSKKPPRPARYHRKTVLETTEFAPFPWERPGLSRAGRVITFLEFLPITKGILRGKRMRLLPHQRAFVERVYSGNVRLAVSSVSRGNGKTGLIAGLVCCHLVGPEAEPRGAVYSAACNTKQASLVFAEVDATIRAVPEFKQFEIKTTSFWKKMEVRAGPGAGTIYEVLPGDKEAAHGLAPSLWIYDELGIAPDRQLLDALQTGSGKRDRSLGIAISTQAADDRHPFSQLIDDAVKNEDPDIVVQLIAAGDDEDPFDEATIRRVNPALGIFLNEREILAEAAQAKRSPAFEPKFRNLRLNQRVDTRTEKRLLTPAQWALGNAPVDEAALAGKECIGGLDLSRKIDLTALVLAFDGEEGTKQLVGRYWTPLEALDGRSQAERELFQQWLKAGHLIGIEGPVIRLDFVAREIVRLSQQFKIRRIHYDRLYSADRIALNDIGSTVAVSDLGQGYKDFAPCVSNFIEAAVSGKLRHGGHPVLTSAVMGAAVVQDPAGNLKVDKGKSEGSAVCRIDPAVAAIMAAGAKREPAREFMMTFI